MRAELIAVGSELLGPGRRDTNGDWLQQRLECRGVVVAARSCVGDETEQIASQTRCALARAQLVVLTGGLGPTLDDRTREAVARAIERPLERDPLRLDRLRSQLDRLGLRPTEARLRQADRPHGAAWIDNPTGTAAGWSIALDARRLVALPGVSSEMRVMFTRQVEPTLVSRGATAIARGALLICGCTESSIDRRLAGLVDTSVGELTLLSGDRGVELHLRSTGRAAATDVERWIAAARTRLGADVVGSLDESLPAVVGRLLATRKATLATAESCTAGALGQALTSVPGSSAWYRGGLIVYTDELKRELAGVRASSLRQAGAVSEIVARELATGARLRCGARVGVGVTGIAGPSGGTPDKPVGRVHVAIEDDESLHWRLDLSGDRDAVRARTVTFVLDRLRRRWMERK